MTWHLHHHILEDWKGDNIISIARWVDDQVPSLYRCANSQFRGSSCWWLFNLNAPVLHRHRAEEANRDEWSRCVISIFSSPAANFLQTRGSLVLTTILWETSEGENGYVGFVVGRTRTTVNKWQCLKAATRCWRTSFGRFFTCLLALALSRFCLSGALSSQWDTHYVACFHVHLFSVSDASAVEANIRSLCPSLSVYYYCLVGNSSGEVVPLVSSSCHLGCWRASIYAFWVCNGVGIEGE